MISTKPTSTKPTDKLDQPNNIAVFKQIDTWFFRESRPHGSFGVNVLSSIFPPPTRTLMGALRSHIGNHYFSQHPSNKDFSWNNLDNLDELNTVIGNSDHLGSFRPRGVFVMQSIEAYDSQLSDSTCYYPSPINVCQKIHIDKDDKEQNVYFGLTLSAQAYQTDEGNIRLPSLPDKVDSLDKAGIDMKGAKPLEGAWLSKQGWEKVLEGKVEQLNQDERYVRKNEDFIDDEYRLGIQVNSQSRSVIEGQLYQTSHIRLKPTVSLVMPLQVNIQDLEQVAEPDFLSTPSLLRLGGEGRMASLSVLEAGDSRQGLPKAPGNILSEIKHDNDGNVKQCMLYLLTKLKMSEDSWLPKGFVQTDAGWKGQIRGIQVTIVSACIGKAQREGGWDAKQHKPRAIESYLPAGSAFFVEFNDSVTDKDLLDQLHGQSFFEDDEWGEGLMLVGRSLHV